jgi:hypothetical protein
MMLVISVLCHAGLAFGACFWVTVAVLVGCRVVSVPYSVSYFARIGLKDGWMIYNQVLFLRD